MLRFALVSLVLAYASALDLKYRKINDRSWMSLVLLGAVFFALNFIETGNKAAVPLLLSAGITLLLVLVLYYARVMESGDCKILFGISIAVPQAQHLSIFPIFSPGVLTNAIVLSLSLPLFFFIRNAGLLGKIKSKKEFLALFLGYRRKGTEIRPYEALMEDEEGVRLLLDARNIELGKTLSTEKEVWVSPAIPFVVFITLGFLVSVLFGDFVSYIYVRWII